VKVSAVTAPDDNQSSRIGFMAGEIVIPENFDTLGVEAIEGTFYGES